MRSLIYIIGFAIVASPIWSGVLAGVMWQHDYNKSMGDAFGERNFERVCPEYKAASTWDQWFDSRMTRISWCSDYIDRLP